MHLNSSLLFEKYAKAFFKNNMRVLEIDPDDYPSTYNKIVNNNTIIWETLDINRIQQLTYIAENQYKFPIPDNTFDIVVSGQVVEHIRKIWVWFKEVARVCKMGGGCYYNCSCVLAFSRIPCRLLAYLSGRNEGFV